MKHGFDIPVAVFLFNRPDRLRQLLAVLRAVRPRRILAIADGPRDSVPTDAERCRAARAEIDRIDWPCSIERNLSATNLGCDPRVQSGLDWVFQRAPRAIILEDDVLPVPSFFPWAGSMLDRFGGDPRFGTVTARNPLGRWGQAGADHIRATSANVWGWATTAQAWHQINEVDLKGSPDLAPAEASTLHLDPLLEEYLALHLAAARRPGMNAWDILFGLRLLLGRFFGIVPPENLARNTGIGPDATHTTHHDDLAALLPCGNAPAPAPDSDGPGHGFDRAVLLVRLVARCTHPPIAARLGRLLARGTHLPIDAMARLHLRPFQFAAETLAAIDRIVAFGARSASIDHLRASLHNATSA